MWRRLVRLRLAVVISLLVGRWMVVGFTVAVRRRWLRMTIVRLGRRLRVSVIWLVGRRRKIRIRLAGAVALLA